MILCCCKNERIVVVAMEEKTLLMYAKDLRQANCESIGVTELFAVFAYEIISGIVLGKSGSHPFADSAV